MHRVSLAGLVSRVSPSYLKSEKGSGQKGHISLSPRLKSYVANQIAESQSHDVAGMQSAPYSCNLARGQNDSEPESDIDGSKTSS